MIQPTPDASRPYLKLNLGLAETALSTAMKYTHVLKVEQFHELAAALHTIRLVQKEIERGNN